MKPSSIKITGQDIDISSLTKIQYDYYLKLSEKITSLYTKEGKDRLVIGLSGPAGAGKSVVTELLTHIFNQKQVPFEYINIGLDAFHFTNTELDEKQLRGVKGRYDTYDLTKLNEKLHTFTEGEKVTFPIYSRETHNPAPDSISVTADKAIILLEGQWLLRNTPEWENIRNLCSYQFSISGPNESLKENVIKRHIAGGKKQSEAETFYQESDLVNTEEIERNSIKANETLLFYREI